jgi:DNA polymerase I-like protein with 3'-5' exonuclease and polymerase domains
MHKEYPIFNYLVQGSAADLNKKAIVDADKAGLFEVLTPHITVHDELGVSIPRTRIGMEAYKELKHVMETAVTLKVPVVAGAEIGDSWGSTKEIMADGSKDKDGELNKITFENLLKRYA